jgi:hypothetical protein
MKPFLALPFLLGSAVAWGEIGHRTVAYLAYGFLQPATQAYVDGVLAYDDGRDVSDGAIWPDQIRHHRRETAHWHYIGRCKAVFSLLKLTSSRCPRLAAGGVPRAVPGRLRNRERRVYNIRHQ